MWRFSLHSDRKIGFKSYSNPKSFVKNKPLLIKKSLAVFSWGRNPTYVIWQTQTLPFEGRTEIATWLEKMSSIYTKTFLKSSWLLTKYLLLGSAQGHSGLKFHNELVFLKTLSFYYFHLSTLSFLCIYDNSLHPKWLIIDFWDLAVLIFPKRRLCFSHFPR